ncbi:MAG: hypothetical protein P4L83_02190 [Nevskia sp.]|nr:hypothetical protein [Nevskia sp.]
MGIRRDYLAILLLALVPALAPAQGGPDPEGDALRAENAVLKARIDALERSCVAAKPAAMTQPATPPPSAAGAASVGASPAASPAPTPALPVAAPVPATPAAPAVATSTAAALPVPVPAGYKLVPVNAPDYIDPLAPPYERTGCSRGALQGPPPLKWNNADNWQGLHRGQSMAEVEDQLGKEHHDVSGHGLVEWQYGKCGKAVSGAVRFDKGQVLSWQVPEF